MIILLYYRDQLLEIPVRKGSAGDFDFNEIHVNGYIIIMVAYWRVMHFRIYLAIMYNYGL